MTNISINKDNLDALGALVTHLWERSVSFYEAADFERPGTLSMLYRGKAEAYETAHDLLVDALGIDPMEPITESAVEDRQVEATGVVRDGVVTVTHRRTPPRETCPRCGHCPAYTPPDYPCDHLVEVS